jgi:hypothetical protein
MNAATSAKRALRPTGALLEPSAQPPPLLDAPGAATGSGSESPAPSMSP